METGIREKLRIARESLGFTQKTIGQASGCLQSKVSLLETKPKTHMIDAYLSFLAKKKINLTALFDESVSEEDFKAICEGKVQLALPAHGEPAECDQCKVKDHEISMLNTIIKTQEIKWNYL
ncbi:MAG TPA: helix-turn-helix transcriptional regulator [Smithellaceae bacterium]|nr:helix-turn-helix transcriptional regulator [Smithellaceae bacterium]